MKKTTRFIALVCAILMMLCLCACGMSNSEHMLGETSFRYFAAFMDGNGFKYTTEYSKRGDLEITIHAPATKAWDKYVQEFDLASREMILTVGAACVAYAIDQNIILDDVTVVMVDVKGDVKYKAVNGNIIKTPWEALYEN